MTSPKHQCEPIGHSQAPARRFQKTILNDNQPTLDEVIQDFCFFRERHIFVSFRNVLQRDALFCAQGEEAGFEPPLRRG